MTAEILKKKSIPVLQKYDVIKAALFGSWVRNEQSDSSDIDLLIEFEGEKSLIDLVGLEFELEKILKRKVDLLTFDSIHSKLKKDILSDQEIFYEKKSKSVS